MTETLLDNLSLISPICNGLIGLGGLLVAGLSAYWVFRSRIEPIKQLLYEQQSAGARETMDALLDVYQAVEDFRRSATDPQVSVGPHNHEDYRAKVAAPAERLKKVLVRWAPVLPPNVFAPMVQFLSVVEYSLGQREVPDGWVGSSYPAAEPWLWLPGHLADSVLAIRKFLGIGPLAISIAKTIGKEEEPERPIVDERAQLLAYLISHDYVPYGAWRVEESR